MFIYKTCRETRQQAESQGRIKLLVGPMPKTFGGGLSFCMPLSGLML